MINLTLKDIPSYEDAMRAIRIDLMRSKRHTIVGYLKEFSREYVDSFEQTDNLNDEMQHVEDLRCLARVIKILEK